MGPSATPPARWGIPFLPQIITFDAHGVSGHPNHIALAKGSAFFIERLSPPHPSLTAFALKTVPILPKYSGNLAAAYQHLIYIADALLLQLTPANHSFRNPRSIVFVSSFWGYAKALGAMKKHSSQLVWFRYLYLLTSQYMWVNEWDVLAQSIA